MARKVELSKSAIENIFRLRTNGMAFKKIADRYPCSDHFIRDIISRKVYRHVEIDAGLVHGAQNAKAKYSRAKHKEEKTVADKYEPLSRLMLAQEGLSKAYKECCEAGLSRKFLDLALVEVRANLD
jgi:hypothetical protein